jgi:endoglucanase
MVSNGYPVQRLEKAGAHFDANTNPDLVAWFPQWIQSVGCEGPGGRTDSWVSRLRTGTNVVGVEEPTWTTGHTHPPHGQGLVDFLSSKWVGVVRIMFSWESIQSALLEAIPGTGAALTYFNNLKATINKFLAKGIYALICPWGYNPAAGDAGDTDITYRGSAFTPAQFGDFWGKMASAFSYDQRIAFGLMNEPHTGGGSIIGVTLDNWFLDAQAAIDAIRLAGAANYIVVPGMGYASAGSWVSNGSAAKFIALTDTYSPKRLIAECHNYGDQFPKNAGNNLGPNMQAMVTHARANGYKIFVGEVARSANPITNPSSADDITAWANWVTFCATTNSGVVLGWAWWAVDDNTIADWGTDFFHWSLVAAGKNNVNTQFMNLIQGSFVT